MYRYLMNGTNRAFEIVRDRLGDIIRVHRTVYVHRGRYDGADLRRVRAEHGVGRPPRAVSPELTLFASITARMSSGMSQRATARALGIHLSKLQRTLAKGELAAA